MLSTSDPVRVYEDFATIDLISKGRAEIVAGRGSRVGAYSLLGFDVHDYEELFEEKLELLMKLNNEPIVTWKGQFHAQLQHASILPQPLHGHMPIWRAVGGPPASAIKAGNAGVPMMLTTLGGPAINFKATADAYREAAHKVVLIQQLYPLQQRVYFIQQKIHRMHYLSIILILIQGCRRYVAVVILNNNLYNLQIIVMH